jgi:hypothetical protein
MNVVYFPFFAHETGERLQLALGFFAAGQLRATPTVEIGVTQIQERNRFRLLAEVPEVQRDEMSSVGLPY